MSFFKVCLNRLVSRNQRYRQNNLFSKSNGDELWPFEISLYLRPRGTAQITTQCVVILGGGAGQSPHTISQSAY